MRFDHDPDSSERVVPIDLGLQQEAAVPGPTLLQSERRAFLVFNLREGTLAEPWKGVVEWTSCQGAVLGGLNDEAFSGHPLYQRGLDELPYGSGEVIDSAWVREEDEANARGYLRPDHSPEVVERLTAPSTQRHFIMEFHDSSFECIAGGFISYRTVERWRAIMESLLDCVVDHDREVPFEEVGRG